MTDRLQRLADMAVEIVSQEAVVAEESGFVMKINDETLTFFETEGDTGAFYCRAMIGSFGDGECPCDFAEAALKGNFFWQATEGAALSLNEDENAIYLTDRFDKGAFEDERAFSDYLNDLLQCIYDWQVRLENSTTAKEA